MCTSFGTRPRIRIDPLLVEKGQDQTESPHVGYGEEYHKEFCRMGWPEHEVFCFAAYPANQTIDERTPGSFQDLASQGSLRMCL